MKPEIQAQWVAALRSGTYKQGTGVLRTGDDEYCCLGVLCDLAVKAGVDVNVTQRHDGDDNPLAYAYDYDSSFLPTAVMEWAGIPNNDPLIGGAADARDTAATANDNGLDFATIATLIEQGVDA